MGGGNGLGSRSVVDQMCWSMREDVVKRNWKVYHGSAVLENDNDSDGWRLAAGGRRQQDKSR